MKQELATVKIHKPVQGDYFCLTLSTTEIGPLVQPGQFLELRVPHSADTVLRRPFSIYNVEGDSVSILYKVVGKGTRAMQRLNTGESVDIIGPLGNGFPVLTKGNFPVLLAGGYGAAALFLQARRSAKKGVILIGGQRKLDILCTKEFKELGWEVVVSTEDGSLGKKGLITKAFDRWLTHRDFYLWSGRIATRNGRPGKKQQVLRLALHGSPYGLRDGCLFDLCD